MERVRTHEAIDLAMRFFRSFAALRVYNLDRLKRVLVLERGGLVREVLVL